jgi:DNA-3-methyladenine glycosylase II
MRNRKIITLDSESIKYLINADSQFIILYNLIGELTYQLNYDPYAFIVETIIGQMLSNKVAAILSSRLKSLCHTGKIDIDSIQKLSAHNLRSIGISQRKVQCIIDFTNSYNKNEYSFKKLSLLSDDEIIKRITSIKGLGAWSAKMFLLFIMDRENILPYEDMAFLQAFIWYNGLQAVPKTVEIKTVSKKWEPYRSIMARYLYRALDNGLTKKPFYSYRN